MAKKLTQEQLAFEAEIDLKKKQPVFEFKGVNAQNQEQKLKFSGTDAAQVVENKTDGAANKKYLDRLAAAKIGINDAIATALNVSLERMSLDLCCYDYFRARRCTCRHRGRGRCTSWAGCG